MVVRFFTSQEFYSLYLLVFCFASSNAGVTVVGVGSGFSAALIRGMISSYLMSSNVDVEVSFQQTKDEIAGCLIKNGIDKCNASNMGISRNVDFAAISEPFLTSDYSSATDLQLFPLAVGAVVPVLHLPFLTLTAVSANPPPPPPNGQAGAFVLTPSILADIFCGEITVWNHPSIIAVNTEYETQLNQLSSGDRIIKVVVPSEQAPETKVFTSSLSALNAFFRNRIGISDLPLWQNSFFRRSPGAGVATLVSSTVGSIGYMQMGTASLYQLFVPTLQMLPDHSALAANLDSIAFAAIELGSGFGNDPDDPDPSHLTASLINGPDLESWPMTLYIYLAVRTQNGLNNDCQSQSAMAHMWNWYFSSPAARQIVEDFGFSYLPDRVQGQVLGVYQTVMTCDGTPVFESLSAAPVMVLVTPILSTWFNFVVGSFSEIFHQGTLSEVSGNGLIGSNHMSIQESIGMRAEVHSSKSFLSFPLFGSAFVFVCNWPESLGELSSLVLDSNLMSKIFSGHVRNWNDPQILLLNPFVENILLNTSQKIVIYYSEQSLSQQQSLLQGFGVTAPLNTNFTNAKSDTLQTLMAVSTTPFSIGFVPFTNEIQSFSLNVFSVKHNDGHIIAPSQTSFSECTHDTLYFDPVLHYDLPASFNPNCFPFTFAYDVVIRHDFSGTDCATPQSPGYVAASFLRWILKRGNLQKVLSSWDTVDSVFPLNGPNNVYQEIQQALLEITCNGHSILKVDQNYNYISFWSVPLANSIFAIVSGVGAIFVTWMFIFRRENVIKLSQPGFMLLFTIGVLTMTSSLIPLSFDDAGINYYTVDGVLNLLQNCSKLDTACMSVPWLYLTGCALEYSALLVKVVRLKRILLAQSYKRVIVTFWTMSPFLFASLIVAWIICAVWTSYDPLHWHRFPVAFDENGIMIDSFGQCSSLHIGAFFTTVFVGQFAVLLYGSYLCYVTRNVKEDFVEGKWISVILLNLMSTLLFSVVLGMFLHNQPKAIFLIFVINILMNGMCSMVLLFVPRIQPMLSKKFVQIVTNSGNVCASGDMRRMSQPLSATPNQSIRGSQNNSILINKHSSATSSEQSGPQNVRRTIVVGSEL